jgi:hypothetical protein
VLDLVETHTDDGRVILAEETKLKSLDFGAPTEQRRSVIQPSEHRLGEQRADEVFLRLVNRLHDEYPTLLNSRDEQSLIVRHAAFAKYLSPGENWLALNPAVGCRFGWSVGVIGLFRWEDEAGRTAVESVWWQDSNPNHSSLEIRSEVGEGWLVLATKRAFSQISEAVGPLKRSVLVTRQRTEESGEKPIAEARSDTDVSPLE